MMKYRIKDETERKLIKALFGITEFTSEFQDNSLSIRASFAGNDFGIANWGGGFFYPVDSNIFAWQEMPKIWKGD